MYKLKTIATVSVLAISVGACASGPSMHEMTKANFVKMSPGEDSNAKFEGIRNRCAQTASNRGNTDLLGKYNYNLGATGAAGLQQSLGNLTAVLQSRQAEKSTFQNCMAQHGYYPS